MLLETLINMNISSYEVVVMWVDADETWAFQEVLRVFQSSGKPYKTGHFRSVTPKDEKR
jgi:hypothetical protein